MSYALVVAKTVFNAEKAIGLVTDSLSTKNLGLEPPPSRGTFSGFWQNVEYS